MKAKILFPYISFKRLLDKIRGIEDKIDEQNEKIPFPLAIDENGNYGYIKEGADSVTPFKSGFNIEEPLFKSNMATTFTLNNCIVGKEYIVIYAPWSSSGYSTANGYLSISSYSGCEAPVTLYSGNDTHRSAYRFYKFKATATTVKIQWHTGGGGPLFVFGQ